MSKWSPSRGWGYSNNQNSYFQDTSAYFIAIFFRMAVCTPLTVWPATLETLREILEIDSGKRLACHGMSQKKKQRCKNKGSHDRSLKVTSLLGQIFKLGSFEAAGDLFSDLTGLIMCYAHVSQRSEWATKWEKKLKPIKQAVLVKTEKEEEERDNDDTAGCKDIPEIDVDTIMTVQESPVPEIKIEDENSIEETALANVNIHDEDSQIRPSSPTPSDIPTSPSSTSLKATGPNHTFESFGDSRSTKVLNQEIKKWILRPLLPKETSSDGRIYIYTFPTSYRDVRPYLKIGFTNDLKTRMASWRRKCGYEPRVLTDTGAECYVKVEKLVHAQLWNARKREKVCPGCEGEHREWFDVTWADAAASVALWADLMRQEPYDEKGMLREEWATRLQEVDLMDPRCWNTFVNGEKIDDSGYESA
ncbi:Fc.00g102090.m01.CDS01 [Cosmosporella sp. VM-42]